jgi:hypothetical protein
MILTDADAIAAGYPNLASYRFAYRQAAVHDDRLDYADAVSRRQRQLTAKLQDVPGSGTTLKAQAVDPLKRRSALIERGQWTEEDERKFLAGR